MNTVSTVFIELKGEDAKTLLLRLATHLKTRDGCKTLRLLESTVEADLYLLVVDLAADETLPPLPPGALVWTFKPLSLGLGT